MNKRDNKRDNRKRDNKRKDVPIVIINVNPEELHYRNDDDIRHLSDRLNKNLRLARSRRDDKSAASIEKEICYVQREQNMRVKRKKIHEKFTSK